MLTIFIIISIILSLVFFKGSFKNLQDCEIKLIWFPVIALFIQMFLSVASKNALFEREPIFPILLCISYIFLFLFIFANRKEHTLFGVLSFFGALCNFLVISMNNFYMPISQKVFELSQFFTIPAANQFSYKIADAATRLLFLGDIIYIPLSPIRGFASVGDILLGIGVGILIIELMRNKKIL